MSHKMNWFQYWIGHCWMTGWQSIRGTFRIWCDLMTDNFEDYALLKTDDPFTECYEWFWGSLNEDDTYPKEFLEYLMDLCDKVERGEEKLIPLGEDFMKELEELSEDIED